MYPWVILKYNDNFNKFSLFIYTYLSFISLLQFSLFNLYMLMKNASYKIKLIVN